MSISTTLRDGSGVEVNLIHNSDWSGSVTVQWRTYNPHGDKMRGEFKVPGDVARVLLHGLSYEKYDELAMRLRELLEES